MSESGRLHRDAAGSDRGEHQGNGVAPDQPPGVDRWASYAGRQDRPPLVRIGRLAWAVLGIAGVFVLGWLVATRLAVVVVPLLLALFPAALLSPAVGLLHRHRLPRPDDGASVERG